MADSKREEEIDKELRDLDLKAMAEEAERDAAYKAATGGQSSSKAVENKVEGNKPHNTVVDEETATTTAAEANSSSPSKARSSRHVATFGDDGTVALMTLDQQKDQKAVNANAIARAFEECENLLSMQESSLSYITNKTPLYKQKFSQSHSTVSDVEEKYKWCAPCGWSMGRLIEQYDMRLQADDIHKLNALGTPASSEVRTILSELSQTTLSKSRLVQRRESLKAFNKYCPHNIADVTIGLYEYLHTDVLAHAKNELSRTEVGKVRVLKQIEYYQQMKEEAYTRGDVAVLEESHRSMIEQYNELLEILNSRLDQLLLSGNDTQHFRHQLETVKGDANDSYGTLDEVKRKLLDDTIADLAKTERTRETENQVHLSAINDYVERSSSAMKKLQGNAKAQEDLLTIIRESFEKLQALGEERKVMVEKQLQAKQDEELRIANYLEFSASQSQHQAELLKLKDHAEGCCALASMLLDYKHKMSGALDKRQVEGELESICLDEAKTYLRHYKGSTMCTGELLDRKRHRLDAMQRQSRQLNLQRETAVESLDPESAKYAAELQSLSEQTDSCQAVIAHLTSMQELNMSNFKKTEDFLRKEGVQFVHPMVEQNERSAENRKKFIERTLRYVEEEERELDKTREKISRQKQLTNSEREETQKRLTAKQKPLSSAPFAKEGEGIQDQSSSAKAAQEGDQQADGASSSTTLTPKPPSPSAVEASPKKKILE